LPVREIPVVHDRRDASVKIMVRLSNHIGISRIPRKPIHKATTPAYSGKIHGLGKLNRRDDRSLVVRALEEFGATLSGRRVEY
jgi:hypothetical protein